MESESILIQQQLSEHIKESVDDQINEIIDNNDVYWKGWKDTPLWYWIMCISGEAGELSNAAKKHYRWKWGWKGKKLDADQWKMCATEELGDIFIYWTLICSSMGLEPDDVISKCLIKNYKRVEP